MEKRSNETVEVLRETIERYKKVITICANAKIKETQRITYVYATKKKSAIYSGVKSKAIEEYN